MNVEQSARDYVTKRQAAPGWVGTLVVKWYSPHTQRTPAFVEGGSLVLG